MCKLDGSVICVVMVLLSLLASADVGAEWVGLAPGRSQAASLELSTQQGQDTILVRVEVPGMTLQERSGPDKLPYVSLNVAGCGSGAEKFGLPALPFRNILVDVPHGQEIEVRVLSAGFNSIRTGIQVFPHQPPIPDTHQQIQAAFVKDSKAYSQDEWLPSDPVRVTEYYVVRGHKMGVVSIRPFRLRPASGELQACNYMEFELSFTGKVDVAREARKASLESPVFAKSLWALAINSEYRNEGAPAKTVTTDEFQEGYLIICEDALEDEIEPLAEWKRDKGYSVHVATRTDVYNYSVQDTFQLRVKKYISDAYYGTNENVDVVPVYVLLVGDHHADSLPGMWYDYDDPGIDQAYTDNRFVCVDGTGESYPTIYPDIVIGRISTRDSDECTVVVDKSILYDKTPATGDWYENFLGAACYHDLNNDHYEDGVYTPEGEQEVVQGWYMETINQLSDFLEDTQDGPGMTIQTAWTSHAGASSPYRYSDVPYTHRPAGYSGETIPQAVLNLWEEDDGIGGMVTSEINAGVGLVMYRGHGTNLEWMAPSFSTLNIANLHNPTYYLDNGEMTPIVLSVCCNTGMYWANYGPCFCEEFMNVEDAGCVGILGASEESFTDLNEMFARGILTCFWPECDTDYTESGGEDDEKYPQSFRPAMAMTYGKNYMRLWYVLEHAMDNYVRAMFHLYNYFGDPELMLRTIEPQHINATWAFDHSESVVYVRVKNDSGDAEGVRCALSDSSLDGSIAALTDSNGQCILDFGTYFATYDLGFVNSGQNLRPMVRVLGHAADTQEDFWEIDIDELYRVVDDLYDNEDYQISNSTDDGYAPGTGYYAGYKHHTDYNPANWAITLTEILRLIQFYNSAGYEVDPNGEDGFAPVASKGAGGEAPWLVARGEAVAAGLDSTEIILTIAEKTQGAAMTAFGISIDLPKDADFALAKGQVLPPAVVKRTERGVELVWLEMPAMPLTVRGIVSGTRPENMASAEGAVLYRASAGELTCPLTFSSKQAPGSGEGV